MKTYTGSCHCGAVAFEFTSDPITEALSCNCSRCSKLGSLLHFAPVQNFTLLRGTENLTEYRFNKKQISHRFCATCGIQSFAFGTAPDGQQTAAINLRSVDGIDPGALKINAFNGKEY